MPRTKVRLSRIGARSGPSPSGVERSFASSRSRKAIQAPTATNEAAAGRCVLVGDPGRTYLPRSGLERITAYSVKTTRELEDSDLDNVTAAQGYSVVMVNNQPDAGPSHSGTSPSWYGRAPWAPAKVS